MDIYRRRRAERRGICKLNRTEYPFVVARKLDVQLSWRI